MRNIDCLLVGYFGGELNFDKPAEKLAGKVEEMKEFNAAVAYLGTFLHRRGFSFDYINYIEDEYETLRSKLEANNVLSVGISTTYCLDNEIVRKLVKLVRNIKPNIKIILGGPHISNLLKYTRDKEILNMELRKIDADICINSYEGETALYNSVLALKNGQALHNVANICYKNQTVYEFTEAYDENNDLESNMVDWGLFYDRIEEVVPVRTAISCPFSCAYCNHPLNAGKYRYVSTEAIIRELDSIESTKKVKYVDFVDDTFNIPQSRFKEILRIMIEKKYSFKWFSYIRCQFLDEETVELMKQCGCIGAMLGIESGSPKMLEIMNKKVTVEELKRGIVLLNKHEIPTVALFFLGFPGETYETVTQTIEFMNETKPSFYVARTWVYDPRTPIGKQSDKYGIKGFMNKWSHNTMNSTVAEKLLKLTTLAIKNSIEAKYSAPLMHKLAASGLTIEEINKL